MVNVHEVRYEYEKQSEVYVTTSIRNITCEYHLEHGSQGIYYLFRRAALAEELAVLRQVDEFASKGVSPPRGKNGFSRYNCNYNQIIYEWVESGYV